MSFIVVYDDGDAICCPMVADQDNKGAIHSGNGTVALFDSRQAAAKAIRISVLVAQLAKERGEAANDDFLTYRKHVKIRPAEAFKG